MPPNLSLNKKAGFTLMELMLVVIIVGAIASLSFPIMSSQLRKVYADEAISTLGSIHSQLRLNKTQTGYYSKYTDASGALVQINAGPVSDKIPPFNDQNLTRSYFVAQDYTVKSISQNAFVIEAKGSKAKVSGITITINQDGTVAGSGY